FDANGNHEETVPVAFANLNPGTYSLQQNFLVGKDIKTDETVTNGTLSTKVHLFAQNIVLLELTKQ
ncbi:MAG: hypothetical protein AAB276_07420, partial [Pseudomonadota bacterium]